MLAGTNGEAVVMTAEEKAKLVQTTRAAATRLGRADLPITMGCGGQSTRAVIAETELAAAAGADFALVLVPSYFHFAMDADAIVAFFRELADASPLPVLVYNFPGVVAGLDVNSDMLSALGRHPNIVGVKLTCGGIAKVARIAAEFAPDQFCALAGQSDWLVPAMSVGSTGSITGVANLYPRVSRLSSLLRFPLLRQPRNKPGVLTPSSQFCIEVFDLYRAGRTKEAEAAQLQLARMEWGFGKGGINGTKWVVASLLGYPTEKAHCRRPYPQFVDEKKQAWITDTVRPLLEEEQKLNKRAAAAATV